MDDAIEVLDQKLNEAERQLMEALIIAESARRNIGLYTQAIQDLEQAKLDNELNGKLRDDS